MNCGTLCCGVVFLGGFVFAGGMWFGVMGKWNVLTIGYGERLGDWIEF